MRAPARTLLGYFFLGTRGCLGILFLAAGLLKGSDSARFAVALVPFTFLPSTWIGAISLLIPILETLGGVLILVERTKRAGAGILLFLCLLFMVALGWALANGMIVSCSCFGREETPSESAMIVAFTRDILLAVLSAAVLLEDPINSWLGIRAPLGKGFRGM